jgi:hypothetical protein
MTSHSLKPIPVEGEYHLSINDLRICGEIVLGAIDKISAASLLAEPLLWPFDSLLDDPGESFNKAWLPLCLERLPAFSVDAIDFLP